MVENLSPSIAVYISLESLNFPLNIALHALHCEMMHGHTQRQREIKHGCMSRRGLILKICKNIESQSIFKI